MPFGPPGNYVANVFLNADSWLPVRYREADTIARSISEFLKKRLFFRPFISVYGDPDKFSEEDVAYGYYTPLWALRIPENTSALDRLYAMLVNLVLLAEIDLKRQSQLVVITRLSDDSKMISSVVASLRQRGYNVIFALPDLDNAQSSDITVLKEHNDCRDRIPVWLCPDLFDLEEDQVLEYGSVDFRNFIQALPPDSHSVSFHMPTGVDTCVLWDLEDYPFPENLQVDEFCDNLNASLPSPCGGVSIYLYAVKEDTRFSQTPHPGVTYVPNAPANKVARLAKMGMDSLLWSMDNLTCESPRVPGPSLVLISKLLEHDILNMTFVLQGLAFRTDHKVYLAVSNVKNAPQRLDVPLLSWQLLSSPKHPPPTSTSTLSSPECPPPPPTSTSTSHHVGSVQNRCLFVGCILLLWFYLLFWLWFETSQ